MDYSNNNSELHLIRIEEIQLIRSLNPFRIKSKWINTAFNFLSFFTMLSVPIAAAKNVQRNREEFIIDPPRIEGKRSHQEKHISKAIYIWKHLFSFA